MNRKDIYFGIIYVFVAISSIWKLLLEKGTVGLRHDWAIPPYTSQVVEQLIDTFFLWNDTEGVSLVYPTLNYFKMFEAGLWILAGGDGATLTKLLISILILFSGLAMYYYCRTCEIQPTAAFVAGLYYMVTPLMYNKVIAGHYLYIFSYLLTPIIVIQIRKGITRNKIQWDKVVLAGLIYGVAWAQFQFAFLILLIVVIVFPFLLMSQDYTPLSAIKRTAVTTSVLMVIGALLQAYWIVPFMLGTKNTLSIDSLAPLSYYEIQNAPNIFEAFAAIGYPHPYDYAELFQGVLPRVYILVLYIPIVTGILAIVYRGEKESVISSAVILVLGLLLVTSINGPLKGFWSVLYINIPIMKVFREVYHFMYLVVFSTAILLSESADYLLNRLNFTYEIRQLVAVGCVILMLFSYSFPVMSGDFLQQTQTYEYPNGTQRVYDQLEGTDQRYRVLYLPSMQPIEYKSTSYPGIDPTILYSPQPTFSPRVYRDNSLDRYGKYTVLTLRKNMTGIEPLLKNSGTEKIIYRETANSRYLDYVNSTWRERRRWELTSGTLIEQSGINQSASYRDIQIYKLNESTEFISATDHPVMVQGDLSTIPKLSQTVGGGVVFAPNVAGSENQVFNSSQTVIVDGSAAPPFSLTGSSQQISFQAGEGLMANQWVNEPSAWWRVPKIAAQTLYYGPYTVLTNAYDTLPGEVRPSQSDLTASWSFTSKNSLIDWRKSTDDVQFGARQTLKQTNGTLEISLYDSTNNWKTAQSPPVKINTDSPYKIQLQIKGINAHLPHIKVVELDKEMKVLHSEQIASLPNGSFNQRTISKNYHPKSPSTEYLRVEIWHGQDTPQPLPNQLKVDNIKVWNMSQYANSVVTETKFSVNNSDEYRVFLRYLQNPNGGSIQPALDGRTTSVDTRNNVSYFAWKNMGKYRLSKGEHNISVENKQGFNAVSGIFLLPEKEYQERNLDIDRKLSNKNIIQLFEAESDLRNVHGAVERPENVRVSNGEVVDYKFGGRGVREFNALKGGTYKLSVQGKGSFTITVNNRSFDFKSNSNQRKVFEPVYLNEGPNQITVETASLIRNYEFNQNRDLSALEKNYQVSMSNIGFKDNSSLRVSVNDSLPRWSYIPTPSIKVTPGRTYGFETHMKTENANKSHIVIEGYNKSNNSWTQLQQVPPATNGTSNWSEYRSRITVPRGTTEIRYILNAGWVHADSQGNATTYFDNLEVHSVQDRELDTLRLLSSSNSPSPGGSLEIVEQNSTESIESYERVSRTRYEVHVNTSSPFVLSLSEGYSPYWVAKVKNPKGTFHAQSVPLYGGTNGFLINKTGNYTLTLDYQPQQWFIYGGVVSVLTFLGCTVVFIYLNIVSIKSALKLIEKCI